MKTIKNNRVKKGQVWLDCDPRPRGNRALEIVKISRINQKAIVRNQDTGKETVISLHRFNNRANGYALLHDKVAA